MSGSRTSEGHGRDVGGEAAPLAQAVAAMVAGGVERGIAVARLTGRGTYEGTPVDAGTRRCLVDYAYGRIDDGTLRVRLAEFGSTGPGADHPHEPPGAEDDAVHEFLAGLDGDRGTTADPRGESDLVRELLDDLGYWDD